LSQIEIFEGERCIVIAIQGTKDFQNYLLVNGISLGSVLTKNYSPSFSKLINITVGGKMLSLREADFAQIDIVKI